ncbi:MAG: PhzF family phenazine biosynthesis protein [Candidatus Hydrogenedentota bacterium]
MGQRFVQVDAFTNIPFRGNPAAICVMESKPPDAWLQSLANEMNLSETAYLWKRGDAWDLRWFTPAAEVKLCGHATVAAAHMLWEGEHVPLGASCRFNTLSGELVATRDGEWINVDFPAVPESPIPKPEGLEDALGVSVGYTGLSQLDYVLAEVESEQVLREFTPDFTKLRAFPYFGFIVTARSSDPQFDFVSRFFAPSKGVNEDPVTGSAHCTLATYWEKKLGRSEFLAFQASARGGVVRVRRAGDRVILGGQAVTVLKGMLAVEVVF